MSAAFIWEMSWAEWLNRQIESISRSSTLASPCSKSRERILLSPGDLKHGRSSGVIFIFPTFWSNAITFLSRLLTQVAQVINSSSPMTIDLSHLSRIKEKTDMHCVFRATSQTESKADRGIIVSGTSRARIS